jgi:hypothetical protein
MHCGRTATRQTKTTTSEWQSKYALCFLLPAHPWEDLLPGSARGLGADVSGVASTEGFHGGTGRVCALLITFPSTHRKLCSWEVFLRQNIRNAILSLTKKFRSTQLLFPLNLREHCADFSFRAETGRNHRHFPSRSPSTPILMVTLHHSPQLAEEARKVGIRGICPKADIGCVVEGVTAILDNRSYFKN